MRSFLKHTRLYVFFVVLLNALLTRSLARSLACHVLTCFFCHSFLLFTHSIAHALAYKLGCSRVCFLTSLLVVHKINCSLDQLHTRLITHTLACLIVHSLDYSHAWLLTSSIAHSLTCLPVRLLAHSLDCSRVCSFTR